MATTDIQQFAHSSPTEVRAAIRQKLFNAPTTGVAQGYMQVSPIIIPSRFAADFKQFCHTNDKPFPLAGISAQGNSKLPFLGKDIDVKYDLGHYHIYRNGQFSGEVSSLDSIWRDDWVTFTVGCSFSFEDILQSQHIPIRHQQEGKNVPMYNTDIPLHPVGVFGGNMVVSMRPFSTSDAIQAIAITSRYPISHGAPVHMGDPKQIGIHTLDKPDYGDSVHIQSNEIPLFWACGVTILPVMQRAKLPIAIVQKPGYMLVTDILLQSQSTERF